MDNAGTQKTIKTDLMDNTGAQEIKRNTEPEPLRNQLKQIMNSSKSSSNKLRNPCSIDVMSSNPSSNIRNPSSVDEMSSNINELRSPSDEMSSKTRLRSLQSNAEEINSDLATQATSSWHVAVPRNAISNITSKLRSPQRSINRLRTPHSNVEDIQEPENPAYEATSSSYTAEPRYAANNLLFRNNMDFINSRKMNKLVGNNLNYKNKKDENNKDHNEKKNYAGNYATKSNTIVDNMDTKTINIKVVNISTYELKKEEASWKKDWISP